MANVIFVSDSKGLRIQCGSDPVVLDGKSYKDGDTIAQFNQYQTTDVSRGIVLKGFILLEDEKEPEKIAYLKKHEAHKKAYRQVANLPSRTMDNGSVINTGVATGAAVDTASLVKITAEKAIRYGKLEQKLFKGDGTPRADAKEEELNEFNELKKELNL